MSKHKFDLTGLPMRWPLHGRLTGACLLDDGEMAVAARRYDWTYWQITNATGRDMFLRFADAVAAAAVEVRRRAGEEKKA